MPLIQDEIDKFVNVDDLQKRYEERIKTRHYRGKNNTNNVFFNSKKAKLVRKNKKIIKPTK